MLVKPCPRCECPILYEYFGKYDDDETDKRRCAACGTVFKCVEVDDSPPSAFTRNVVYD